MITAWPLPPVAAMAIPIFLRSSRSALVSQLLPISISTAAGLWVSHDIAERGGEGIHPKAMPVILTSDELRSAMSGCVRHGMRRSRCCGRYRMML